MNQDTPSAELMVPHHYWPQDEHCQNLNIWTKSLDKEAKKPVVVWLHGGGYFAGSSIEQIAYDGYNMCMDGDVVVVSVNHRLNLLGYLDLSPSEKSTKTPGMQAMRIWWRHCAGSIKISPSSAGILRM